MPLRYIIFFLLTQNVTSLCLAGDKTVKTTKSSSQELIQASSDLTFASGHYALEKGQVSSCPDGEFTGGDRFLVVGANQKITNINQGPQVTEEECHEVRDAKLDGEHLTFTQVEECDGDLSSQSNYSFRFYQTSTKAYIDLNIKNVARTLNEPAVQSTTDCLYSRGL